MSSLQNERDKLPLKKLGCLSAIIALALFALFLVLLISSDIASPTQLAQSGTQVTDEPTLPAYVAATVTSVPTEPLPLPPATRAPNRPPPPDTKGEPEESPEPYVPRPTPTPLPPVPAEKREGLWAENLEVGAPEILTTEIKDVEEIAVSPDGKILAVSYRTGQTFFDEKTGYTYFRLFIALIDAASKQVIPLVEQGNLPKWSPDGRLIAFTFADFTEGPDLIRIINVETRTITDVASWESDDFVGEFDWLSSTQLAYYINEPRVYDVETQASSTLLAPDIQSLVDPAAPLTRLAIAPHAGVVAFGSREQVLLFQWQDATLKFIRQIEYGIDHQYLALSPDGRYLAFSRDRAQVVITDVFDADKTIELPSSSRNFAQVRDWSPDSTSFFYLNWPEDGVKIANRDGTGLDTLYTLVMWKAPFWSPQGDRIYWIDAEGYLVFSNVTQK